MDETGRRCPETLHGARTALGRVVIEIGMRPGLIQRAGLQGRACGFDWAAALALRPSGVNIEIFQRLLAAAEQGLLQAVARADPN